jgi:hypothetical protein
LDKITLHELVTTEKESTKILNQILEQANTTTSAS